VFAEAVATVEGLIFPIVQALPREDGFDIEVTGTGFFVDRGGLFLTAHHVMPSVPGSSMLYYGNVPDRVCAAVEIECVAADPARDLYLGRVQRDYLGLVELSAAPLRPGDSACFGGYPMVALSTNSQGGVVGNVRRYWQSTFVVDTADVVVDGRRYLGQMLQHACLRGMCGAPVFDASGMVRGMAAATLTRTVADPGGCSITLHNAIMLDVEHLQKFIEPHLGP
jgi:S1-C subfamily serine protease